MANSVKRQVLEEFSPEVQENGEALEVLVGLLSRYGAVANLTGSLDADSIWREVGEALLAFRALRNHGLSEQNWIDIGSGGGFPGLVFAILDGPSAAASAQLIEPRQKRADFLRLALGQLKIKHVDVHRSKLDEQGLLRPELPGIQPAWVSARAVFAPEEWLQRAGLAWPSAIRMVHTGTGSEGAQAGLLGACTWKDQSVQLWRSVRELGEDKA